MYSLWGHIVGSSHCKNKQSRVIVPQVTVQPVSYRDRLHERVRWSTKSWSEPNTSSHAEQRMVNMAGNIFCISDTWETFCFPSRLPETLRVSWMDRGTGRDHLLGSPARTGCHDCDTRAGLGGQHSTECAPDRAQRGTEWPRGTLTAHQALLGTHQAQHQPGMQNLSEKKQGNCSKL